MPMPSVPTGTVTFLFTDIEGSTSLAQRNPTAWEAARQRHHAILRAAAEAHQGYVFQVVGDAFCVAFATAPDALAAAVRAQHALHAEPWGETPIKARMGLHTGGAEARDGDYFGYLTLAHVQRVMSVAYGGQVLLSGTSAELVRGNLPERIALRDLGEHRLRGLLNVERLWQVVAPDLSQDFPPLQSLSAIPNNLPVQLTSFVGRARELAELQRLLPTTRLLTLTGSGGVGKTRLSLQVAVNAIDAFGDGVWFVELAPLADPTLVPQSIATAIGLREQSGQPLLALLSEYLHTRKVLLVLDNCEHLIAECARVADVLLRAAPGLKILASSREALGIGGELAWHVPSLTVPDPTHLPALADLSQYEAVRLFVERAAFALPAFRLSETSAPTIAKICQRLDGIPLAIELAAARVKALPIESIATRLDDRFRLLTGGSRMALPRQQTLRALIDWSYSLLSEPERVLLRRLSVFAGGWTLEAAEEVCAGDGIGASDILDLLTHLVDKSLVGLDEERARYRLLETIRQYAREKLLDCGEGAQMRTQHLAFYVRLGEAFSSNMFGPDHALSSNRFETEHDNFRTAIEWSLEGNDTLTAMRLAAALRPFWQQHHTAEGLDRLREILARPEAMGRTQARARALYSLGYLEALHGNSSVAPEFLNEAIAIATEAGDEGTVARCFRSLAVAAIRRKDNIAARSFVTQALEISRRLDDQGGIAFAFNSLGDIAQSEEDSEGAQALYSESATIFRRLGMKAALANPLRKLGLLAVRHGDYERAGALIRESLTLNIDVEDKRAIACCLVAAAGLRVARGQLLDAGRLCGAAAALLDAIHTQMFPYDQEQNERNLAALRAQLDPAAFDAALAEGRALTLEQAIAQAERVTVNDPAC